MVIVTLGGVDLLPPPHPIEETATNRQSRKRSTPELKASSKARPLECGIARDDLGRQMASASLEDMAPAVETFKDPHESAYSPGCDFRFLISTRQWHDQHAVIVLIHDHGLIGSWVHGDRKLL